MAREWMSTSGAACVARPRTSQASCAPSRTLIFETAIRAFRSQVLNASYTPAPTPTIPWNAGLPIGFFRRPRLPAPAPIELILPSKHAANALSDLGHDLCRDRFDLLVRHGLFARLQCHRDCDRFLVRINAGALVHIEYRDGGDQLA